MRFVEARGQQVHVEMWEPLADEPPAADVLLIHGASSSIGVFRPSVAPGLRQRYRVAAYDRPGMGFTAARPAGADTLAVQAQVAAGVIDALALEKPIVVGHSFGGAVALRLALDFPDKAGGLVLIAPVAYAWPGGVSWHLHWSANPLVGGVFNHVVTRPFAEAAVRSGMTAAFAPSLVPEGYFEAASIGVAGGPRAMKANADDLVAAKREVAAQQTRYPELRLPIAVLSGDTDSVVSTRIHSRALKAALPAVRLEVLSGVGHLPHETAPELLRALIGWAAQEAASPAR